MTPRQPRETTAHHPEHALVGTAILIRLILRRDRFRLPVWVLAIPGLLATTTVAFPELYPTAEDRQARAALMTNPAATAFAGPGHGLDNYTLGAMLANEMFSFTAIFVALMSVFLVVRHTRAEEAAGRAELVRSAPVGRYATITAVLAVTVGVNLLVGILVAAGLGSLGIESIDWAGSWLFGAALAAVGVAFVGIAILASQITEHPRGASGMAGAAIAVAYSLRAFGDIGNEAISWLSPIGWAQATRMYVDNLWWPLLPAVGFSLACVFAAGVLSNRRDVGAGLVRPRPGPATASRSLSSPLGLAVRMHRSALLWWSAAMALFGVLYGSLVGEVVTFVEDLETLQEIFVAVEDAPLIDGFLSMIVSMFALVVGVYAVVAVQRLRSEEQAGRAEPILSTAVSQTRWVVSHLAVALAGSAVVLVLGVTGLGVSAAITLGDPDLVPRLIGAAVAYLPAVWVFAGLALALFGLVPRLFPAAWALVVYAIVVGIMGGLLGLPDWTFELSPVGHVPRLPAQDLEIAPLIALLVIAADLVILGLVGFRRRDLQSTA